MELEFARVAAVHPEDNSVDLVMIRNGMRMPGIQVLGGFASTRTGLADLPDVTTPPGGKWDMSQATDLDMNAVVGQVGGQLLVLGFLFPQVCEMLFADRNRRVNRHTSDVYSTIDGAANMELAHPSGFFMRVGTSPAHEDLTGKDVDKKWAIKKNTGQNVHFHLEMGGNVMSLNVAPSGNVTLETAGTLTVNVAGTATVNVDGDTSLTTPKLTVDSPESTFTGKVNVGGLLTYTAGMSGSGTGPGGKTAEINGDVHFINGHGITTDGGDIVAGTISLQQHRHPENDGGGNTDPAIP